MNIARRVIGLSLKFIRPERRIFSVDLLTIVINSFRVYYINIFLYLGVRCTRVGLAASPARHIIFYRICTARRSVKTSFVQTIYRRRLFSNIINNVV